MTKTIVFDHRGRTKAGAEGPLEVRITHAGKPYYINTGIKVRGAEFKHGEIVNRGDAAALNERLALVADKIDRAVTRCIERGDAIDVKAIKEQIYQIEELESKESTSLVDWVDEQIPTLNVIERTRSHFRVMAKRLREFGRMNRWQDLTIERIYEWDSWLHNLRRPASNADIQAGRKPGKITQGSVHNYHKDLRSLMARAARVGKIDVNPYDKLSGEFPKGDSENVEFLSEEEMSAVVSLRPIEGTQMAMARDLFVFQMYTGLAYSDAQAFDIRNYKREFVDGIDGKKTERWTHVGERIKTGVPYVSQLLPPVIDVLERYGWQTPKIENGQYNNCLKVIQQALGISSRMHSHLARHTFATWMLSNGVPIEHVSKMVGHTNIRQTQRYAKVLPTAVYDDFERVGAKLVSQDETILLDELPKVDYEIIKKCEKQKNKSLSKKQKL